MSTIEDLQPLLGTDALARSGWLLLRAVRSSEAGRVHALVELVPSQRAVATGLGVLALTLHSRMAGASNQRLLRGTNSLLFTSHDVDIGVLARRDRLVLVAVAAAHTEFATQGVAAAPACEDVDELANDASHVLAKITAAATAPCHVERLPASWTSTKAKAKAPSADEVDETARDDDDDDDAQRPPTMTREESRREWRLQLEDIARKTGESPESLRARADAYVREEMKKLRKR